MAIARKLAIALAAVVVAWIVVLVVLGSVRADSYGEGVAMRVGEPLGATGHVGATELGLVRGRVELDHLALARDDDQGKLTLSVDVIGCNVAPLGWALVDGTCDPITVGGLRLEASNTAVFHVMHPHHTPVYARSVVIDDAEIAFAPNALAPGLGRIAVHVDHAEAGDTVFRTPLSWLFSLRTLHAHVDLLGGARVDLAYVDGKLSASGSLFGSTPVAVPMALPIAAGLADGRAEMEALVTAGKAVAEQMVNKRAEDWLHALTR